MEEVFYFPSRGRKGVTDEARIEGNVVITSVDMGEGNCMDLEVYASEYAVALQAAFDGDTGHVRAYVITWHWNARGERSDVRHVGELPFNMKVASFTEREHLLIVNAVGPAPKVFAAIPPRTAQRILKACS